VLTTSSIWGWFNISDFVWFFANIQPKTWFDMYKGSKCTWGRNNIAKNTVMNGKKYIKFFSVKNNFLYTFSTFIDKISSFFHLSIEILSQTRITNLFHYLYFNIITIFFRGEYYEQDWKYKKNYLGVPLH
jgi:hypothetical protein